MSLTDQIKSRIEELEAQIAPTVSELGRLKSALSALTGDLPKAGRKTGSRSNLPYGELTKRIVNALAQGHTRGVDIARVSSVPVHAALCSLNAMARNGAVQRVARGRYVPVVEAA